jgi:hypothetical protein
VQIVGEQGIGKTRLLAELCALAERRRCVVFSGRSSEFEQAQPFGVLVDALGNFLVVARWSGTGGLEIELDGVAAVFPSLGRRAGYPIVTLPADRHRGFQAVRLLLDALSRRRPVVVALDDVHWADAASVELLSFLLRRPPKGRVLVVMAFRPAPMPKRFVPLIEASARESSAVRLDLDPLTLEEAPGVLDPGLPPSVCDELYRLSGGNAFYLGELARAARRGGVVLAGVVARGAPS